jgi:aldose sugar dehydrogenase
MTRLFFALVITVGLLYGALYFIKPKAAVEVPTQATTTTQTSGATSPLTVIARNLEIPWDVAFLPDGKLLVTERPGDVLLIDPSTGTSSVAHSHSEQRGEGGLLGILLHPNFAQNHFVYLYMTAPGSDNETTNRAVRYVFENGTFTQDRVIIENIPGAIYHDGGRMEFGPDGKLYITTGDATRPAIAQDRASLGGKILRLNDDGTVPSDNPFGTRVWSTGHRNPQGLAWDDSGRLWETEHGPTGESGRCCHDEINLIEKGGNYGWPTIIGDETKSGFINPKWHSNTGTWAPASLVYHEGSLYFGGLKGETLYEAVLDGDNVVELKEHFKGEFNRIRTIRKGPDGMFYITTSNRDGRGNPADDDDKLIRVDPRSLN